MNQLDGVPYHRARLPKTDHDMSQSFGFSSSTGMILPVYYDLLSPDETVYYGGNLFSRSQPLVTAAMADVDVFVDWFFVPLSMLCLNAVNAFYETYDLLSSAYPAAGRTNAGNFPIINITDSVKVTNVVSDYAKYYSDNSLYGVTGEDKRFDCYGVATFRLLNHLGYNPYGVFGSETGDSLASLQHDTSNPNVFCQYALAYQAIWEDYFRVPLDDRIKRNVTSFNVDNLDSSAATVGVDKKYFRLHYRPFNFDYFMSVKTSPIGSGINATGDLSILPDFVKPTQAGNIVPPNSMQNQNFSVNSLNDNATGALGAGWSSDVGVGSSISAIGAQNIRAIFALDKLARITGRAKKDYDSQILAHFGFKVPHDVKHELTHLGCDRAMMHIGEVVSVADTWNGSDQSGAALGSISGKGYVNIQFEKRKFTAPCHGVFMAVYSAVPRLRYCGTFDKQNSVTGRLDLYQPEFDRLGMQPLYTYEAECGVAGSSSNRVGWQWRYSQWKRKYDRVTEAFAPDVYLQQVNQYSAWVISRLPYADDHAIVPPHFDDFLCPPTALDNIMVMPYSTVWHGDYVKSPWLMFGRDPFLNDLHVSCKKVSTMSKFGEPVLD